MWRLSQACKVVADQMLQRCMKGLVSAWGLLHFPYIQSPFCAGNNTTVHGQATVMVVFPF